MRWSKSDIERMHKSGKIKGYSNLGPVKKFPKIDNRSAAKDWIEMNLLYWANENSLEVTPEYKFHDERKWRFDWAIPAIKLAVEYEGGIFQAKSGHNTARHYTKDADKYNSAVAVGWRVLRFTAMNYKNLATELNNITKTTILFNS